MRILNVKGLLASLLVLLLGATIVFLFVANAVAQDAANDESGFKFLEVKVLDPAGKPMPDVEVEVRIDGAAFPIPTDEEGMIGFNIPRGGGISLLLSVQHEGYASIGAIWNRKDKLPEKFTIQMQKGVAIGGIVVDEQGHPIEGVEIEANQADDTPAAADNRLRPMFRGTLATTDAEGRWRWHMAPSAHRSLTFVYTNPLYYITEHSATDKNAWQQLEEQSFTTQMQSVQIVKGRVTDAQTEQPIDGFRVVRGIEHGRDSGIQWWNEGSEELFQSHYQTTSIVPDPNRWRIKIVANGYRSQTSRQIRLKEGELAIDFQLEPDVGQHGIVKRADGKPAEGAELALYAGKTWIQIDDGKIHEDEAAAFTYADKEGRFEFPSFEEQAAIVAVSDYGWAMHYCKADEESFDLILQPWGKISGTARIGQQVASSEVLSLTYPNTIQFDSDGPKINWVSYTDTNAQGKYVFERVRSIPVDMKRQVALVDNSRGTVFLSTTTNNLLVEVEPGETLNVDHGGIGRQVVGQFKLPIENNTDIPWETSVVYVVNPYDQSAPEVFRKQYSAKIERDGRFEIHDVLPGEYELNVHFYVVRNSESQPWDITQTDEKRINRTVKQPLTIPLAAKGKIQSFDLGTHVLQVPESTP